MNKIFRDLKITFLIQHLCHQDRESSVKWQKVALFRFASVLCDQCVLESMWLRLVRCVPRTIRKIFVCMYRFLKSRPEGKQPIVKPRKDGKIILAEPGISAMWSVKLEGFRSLC